MIWELLQDFERAKLTKPFSFLLKPFNELEILYAIEMAIEKFYEQNNVFIKDEIVKLEDNKAKKSEYKNLEKFDNIDYKEFSKEKLSLFSGSLLTTQANIAQDKVLRLT